jgi:hypothetical protein
VRLTKNQKAIADLRAKLDALVADFLPKRDGLELAIEALEAQAGEPKKRAPREKVPQVMA